MYPHLIERDRHCERTVLAELIAKHNRIPKILAAAFVAVFLVILVFPDVVFLRATLSLNGLATGMEQGKRVVALFGEPSHRQWHHPYSDNGGAMWQSEPMQHFIRNAITHGESPYWNPYSGAGQLGPETLVDLKFSPQTLLVSLLGGSEIAFNIVVLCSYMIAVFFLYLLVVNCFELSAWAAIGASVVYILCGYNIANLCSNTTQVYLYFPIGLFALCCFARRPSVIRYLFMVAAHIIILSTTFLPTCFLLLLSIYSTAAGYNLALSIRSRRSFWSASLPILALQLSSAVFAFLALSFLYFPIIESFKVIDAVSMYSARKFYPVNLNSLLSFFSPKHFWEEYNAIPPILFTGPPQHPNFRVLNVMFHYGVVPSVMAAAALMRRKSWQTPVLIVSFLLLLTSLSRIFDLPIIGQFIGLIYGLRSIGEQYWFMTITIAFVISVAFGLDGLAQRMKFEWAPILLLYGIVIASIVYTYASYGIVPSQWYVKACLAFLIALIPLSAVLIYFIKTPRRFSTNTFYGLLILLMFAELTQDAMHYRYVRSNMFLKPLPVVRFLQEHAHYFRVASIGKGALPAEHGSAFQIQQIESLNMNVLPTYQRFFERNFLTDTTRRWGIFPTLFNHRDEPSINEKMLDLLAVRYVTVSKGWPNYQTFLKAHGYRLVFDSPQVVIFENPNVYPRIFAVPALSKAKKTPDIRGLSPRVVAFTPDDHLFALARQAGVATELTRAQLSVIPASALRLDQYHNAYIMATATLKSPAVVVLMDNWHPNWRAFANGKPVYLGIVNESFRGIALPAGKYTIEMCYMPTTLPLAFCLSGAAMTFLALLLAFRHRLNPLLSRLTLLS